MRTSTDEAPGSVVGDPPDGRRRAPALLVVVGVLAFVAVVVVLGRWGPVATPIPRVPLPPRTATPTPTPTPSDDGALGRGRQALLDRRAGFGREAGVGAAGWPRVTVTTLEDTGPGSLRAALAKGHRWIRFSDGLSGTIPLVTELHVPSHVVVDGRGADVTLDGGGRATLLTLHGARNVIVTNLKLRAGDDGVLVRDGAADVWLDHLTFRGSFGDEALDVSGDGSGPAVRPDRITVSWSRFDGVDKAILLGSTATNPDNAPDRITLHHNVYWQTMQRHPLVRFARVHAYNNWLYHWGREGTGQGIRVGSGAEFLSEANIYDDVHGRPALGLESGGATGAIRSEGDVVTGSADFSEWERARVFTPQEYYSYVTHHPGDHLRQLLAQHAGWQGA